MPITKEMKKLFPRALLSYIRTREFLRTLERCGKARAECSEKIPKCFDNSTMLEEKVFLFLL